MRNSVRIYGSDGWSHSVDIRVRSGVHVGFMCGPGPAISALSIKYFVGSSSSMGMNVKEK